MAFIISLRVLFFLSATPLDSSYFMDDTFSNTLFIKQNIFTTSI